MGSTTQIGEHRGVRRRLAYAGPLRLFPVLTIPMRCQPCRGSLYSRLVERCSPATPSLIRFMSATPWNAQKICGSQDDGIYRLRKKRKNSSHRRKDQHWHGKNIKAPADGKKTTGSVMDKAETVHTEVYWLLKSCDALSYCSTSRTSGFPVAVGEWLVLFIVRCSSPFANRPIRHAFLAQGLR